MKQTHILILAIAFLLLQYGCVPSSNTLRYQGNSSKNQVDSTARFTSNDNTTDSESILFDDTTITEEITDDSDSDEFPDEQSIDISSIIQNLGTKSNSQNTAVNNTVKENVLMEIIKFLNTPYLYGGTTKDGIDCSAFTQTVYQNSFQIPLLRSARDQYTQGEEISSTEDLQFGDLVFFNTRRRVRPGHVGIYIGDRLFAHSSSKNGVMVSSLDHEYYSRKFMGGRRLETVLNSKL